MSALVHREAQEELIERVKQAAALPVVISIKDVYDETCTELLVLANLDSGARGRPRVTYDVTAALNAWRMCTLSPLLGMLSSVHKSCTGSWSIVLMAAVSARLQRKGGELFP